MTTSWKKAVLAAGLGMSLLLSACGGGAGNSQSSGGASDAASGGAAAGDGGQITLTVSVFNDFGYEALYKEYMELNPNIKIEEKRTPSGQNAREYLSTQLAAGSGLADIEAVEGDWMPEVILYEDRWVDLTDPALEGRWLDWKAAKATTADGKLLGYGTDSAPNALCYRTDAFAAAGLPTDRNEVAALLQGDWANYFKVGQDFVAKSNGMAWFDSSTTVFQGMISQLPNAFENSDGTPIPLDQNTEIKKVYDLLSANINLSAHLKAWETDWNASFADPKFATIACPSWMAGYIEQQAAGTTGWDIAPVFPGGGSNSGGSFLMVSQESQHQEEAKKLAAWLTAPEQQLKTFASHGMFPSVVEALESPELTAQTNEFFNNAPTGEIFAKQAEAITIQPFTGEYYGQIRDVVGQALDRVDSGQSDAATSWQKALEDYKALGLG